MELAFTGHTVEMGDEDRQKNDRPGDLDRNGQAKGDARQEVVGKSAGLGHAQGRPQGQHDEKGERDVGGGEMAVDDVQRTEAEQKGRNQSGAIVVQPLPQPVNDPERADAEKDHGDAAEGIEGGEIVPARGEEKIEPLEGIHDVHEQRGIEKIVRIKVAAEELPGREHQHPLVIMIGHGQAEADADQPQERAQREDDAQHQSDQPGIVFRRLHLLPFGGVYWRRRSASSFFSSAANSGVKARPPSSFM